MWTTRAFVTENYTCNVYGADANAKATGTRRYQILQAAVEAPDAVLRKGFLPKMLHALLHSVAERQTILLRCKKSANQKVLISAACRPHSKHDLSH